MKHPEWRPKTAVSALGHLIEEAGEVLQQAGSLVRFSAQPDGSITPGRVCQDGLTNFQKLRTELEDLAVAVQRVREMVYGEKVWGGASQTDREAWKAEIVTAPSGTAGTWWCACPGGGALNALNPQSGRCAFCNKTIVNLVEVSGG